MISRRDNLLIRPWQQRRFESHRKKVESAKPAIDNKSPITRDHVVTKLKKKQKEEERCDEIKKNNFNLLKRLSYAMRTSRVDNYWTTPQPNFLNRVTIYNTIMPNLQNLYLHEESSEVISEKKGVSSRKSKCLACTPQQIHEVQIPEERVPWEQEKPKRRTRSKSQPPRPSQAVHLPKKSSSAAKRQNTTSSSSQSIILSRGSLKLSVNFPSDSLVKLQEGNQEKVLVHGICNCKQLIKIRR